VVQRQLAGREVHCGLAGHRQAIQVQPAGSRRWTSRTSRARPPSAARN
jgi:hypothetical protein